MLDEVNFKIQHDTSQIMFSSSCVFWITLLYKIKYSNETRVRNRLYENYYLKCNKTVCKLEFPTVQITEMHYCQPV